MQTSGVDYVDLFFLFDLLQAKPSFLLFEIKDLQILVLQ